MTLFTRMHSIIWNRVTELEFHFVVKLLIKTLIKFKNKMEFQNILPIINDMVSLGFLNLSC